MNDQVNSSEENFSVEEITKLFNLEIPPAKIEFKATQNSMGEGVGV